MKVAGTLLTILCVILCAAFAFGGVVLSVYGIYLAFCASVVLGIVSLFVQPAPLVFGAAQFLFHVNIPVLIMAWLKAHGA